MTGPGPDSADATLAAIRRLLFSDHDLSPHVLRFAELSAGFDTAQYYQQAMLTSAAAESDFALMARAVGWRQAPGLVLEFGVASGRTINNLAALIPDETVYGFDSFQGLPETWRTGYEAGYFAQPIPTVRQNVELVQGLFADTLPGFLAAHSGQVSLLHVDCDLYSATKVILHALDSRIVPGTVIVFDEYFNFPGWRDGEFKAFQEFIAATGRTYTYLGFVPSHQQVCVRIGPPVRREPKVRPAWRKRLRRLTRALRGRPSAKR